MTAPDALTTAGASPTILQAANPGPAVASTTTAVPSSTASASVSPASAPASAPAPANSTAPANPAAPASPTAASTSAVATAAAFATTPAMTVGLVAAIIGTIIGMFTLLIFFIIVRRRITATSARKMDQENTFGRDQRERQMEDGKADPGAWPVLAGKKAQLPVFDMEPKQSEPA